MAVALTPWLSPLVTQYAARLAAGKLHHGVLITGAQGTGLAPFAEALSEIMLCQSPQQGQACGQCQSCQLFAAGTHPDFYVVESDKQIGVDQIREGIRALAGTAQLSGNKVLVLKGADTLTEAAANALLKTLEEPTAKTYLLLTAEKPGQMLPTLLSRCEKTALPIPVRTQTLSWLKEQGIEEVAPLLLHLYAQQPYTLVSMVKEDNKYSPMAFYDVLGQMIGGQHTVSDIAEKWQAHAQQCVDWLMVFTRLSASSTPNRTDANWSFYQKCLQAKQTLMNPGINKSLVLHPLLAFLETHPHMLPEESRFAG